MQVGKTNLKISPTTSHQQTPPLSEERVTNIAQDHINEIAQLQDRLTALEVPPRPWRWSDYYRDFRNLVVVGTSVWAFVSYLIASGQESNS